MIIKTNPSIFIKILFVFFFAYSGSGQTVYKTPSGKKYHTKLCRHIDNTSHAMSLSDAISNFGLTPCSRCKPPHNSSYALGISRRNQSDEIKCDSQQCYGRAKSTRKRCRNRTRNCNGFCARHHPDNNRRVIQGYQGVDNSLGITKTSRKPSTSRKCGARTNKGKLCGRKVKGGGYCYQHR